MTNSLWFWVVIGLLALSAGSAVIEHWKQEREADDTADWRDEL